MKNSILTLSITHLILLYSRIISYNNDWLEPRLTEEIPNEEFNSYTLENPPNITFLNYLVHTQSVEKMIRLVSQSSKICSIPCVFITSMQRKLMPKFNYKSQFVFN